MGDDDSEVVASFFLLYMASYYSRLASAIYNDVYGGLKGYHTNLSLDMDQLEDEVVAERLQIIKEYIIKDMLPRRDFLVSLNCIPVDCKDLEKCNKCLSGGEVSGTPTAHFEIPQLMNDFGGIGIDYIGTVDHTESFTVYTSLQFANRHKYRKRRKDKPYVWLDTTPNENNMIDGYIFNAPFIKYISVVGIFKDLRQVETYDCCQSTDLSQNFTWLDAEIQRRLTTKKLAYYRQYSPPNLPNDQAYRQ